MYECVCVCTYVRMIVFVCVCILTYILILLYSYTCTCRSRWMGGRERASERAGELFVLDASGAPTMRLWGPCRGYVVWFMDMARWVSRSKAEPGSRCAVGSRLKLVGRFGHLRGLGVQLLKLCFHFGVLHASCRMDPVGIPAVGPRVPCLPGLPHREGGPPVRAEGAASRPGPSLNRIFNCCGP